MAFLESADAYSDAYSKDQPFIQGFTGEYRFLSNFWPAEVVFEGITYPTVEHAYQAAKTLNPEHRTWILKAPTPGKAKRRGRDIKLRPEWEDIKVRVMYDLVYQKFSTEPLKSKLLNTDPAPLLHENDHADKFWGVCGTYGENMLGRILMRVRSALKHTDQAATFG